MAENVSQRREGSNVGASDELILLERVFLRIGSAETDEQLQNAVSKFLLPVLLKLSSHQEGVRKKVMELLVHINKRIKCRPKIQLPVEALILQYQDPMATSFITNFTIIYIKMGYPRLEESKQVELIPSVLNCIEGKPQSHQDSLISMLMPVFGRIKIPTDPEKCKSMFRLHEKPKVTKLLLDFMLDVLLLPYGSAVSSPKQPSVQVTVTVEAGTSAGGATASTPPMVSSAPSGLSEYAYKRALGENPLNPEELEQVKLGIVKFLGGGFLPEEEIVVHLIIASSDTRHSVVNAAELELKRRISSVDINSAIVVSKLYSLFLGTITVKDQKSNVKSELKRNSANARIRLKIFPFLLKSREAALQFPACIQVVFDCLYGANTNVKLKMMAVQFVHHICLNCNESRLSPIAPVLLSGMVKLIAEAKEDAKIRSLAFIAVGKLGSKLPQLVTQDLTLLQTFFDAMSKEDQDTRLAIQEALSIMSSAFRNLDSSNLKLMEALLSSSLEKPEPQVRLLAVQYAASVFPSDHIPSRYLLLLAAGDMKEEVYSEASKALHTVPRKTKDNVKDLSFPPFSELMEFIGEKTQQRMKSKQKFVIGVHKLPFNPATCTEMLTYMRLCLAHSAGLTPSLEFTQNIHDQAPAISKYVGRLMDEHPGDRGPVQLYMNFIRQILVAIGGSASMYYLLEMVAVAPQVLAVQFVSQLDWIKGFMFSSKEEMRLNASQLYAIVVAHNLNGPEFSTLLQQFIPLLSDKLVEQQHGATLALGYMLGRKSMLNSRTNPGSWSSIADAKMAVKRIVELLSNNTASMVLTAACVALGEIGRSGPLPVDDGGPKDGEQVTKLTIINKLTSIVKSSKYAVKIQEKAALAISYFCVGEDKFLHRRDVIEGLLQCAGEISDVDLNFTIGEALTCAALGPASPDARDFWTVSEEEFVIHRKLIRSDDFDELMWLIDEILKKYAKSPNPHIKQASCIWLLSLLKRCSGYEVFESRLEDLQNVFIALLSESNELTQDMASKGLGLIYEYSGEECRNKLVSILADALMSGAQRNLSGVTADTKIFDEGTLGSAPQGGGLSTYKELCSLASELNQPDLIYKFLHLANHNAHWNSKKGAAFGFSRIAAKAGEQLQPHLPKIIPKLYRYQFDPNTKIQQSMIAVWNAIVPDSHKMTDLYVKEILADLKTNLTSNAWRTRESSCLALSDLLRGRQLNDVVDDLPDLWETCFRVRDDIKKSVRQAAETALKSLSKITIRLCEANTGSLGQKAIASVLPVLLKSGLLSPVIDVRTISLATITKIGKGAGILLQPHIPLLTVCLLESLSALEQQELSYLSVRLGNQQGTQEKLDNARIAAAKASPMMDTIHQCLPFIDDSVLKELVPRLIDLIKNSVGLGTKAGCAHCITSLTHHCLTMLQPYAAKLLMALLSGLNDRSVAVRKCYASAIGHLVKAAKDSSVEKLIQRLRTSYMDKEDAVARQTCGFVLHAIARQSPDVLKQHSALALPLAFLAMHVPQSKDSELNGETEKCDNSEIWQEIWVEMTPGSEAAIRLYLSEIVSLIQLSLQSNSWNAKAQGAAAVNTVAVKLKSSLVSPHLETLLAAVLSGLSGRTWDGKENLLCAISAICINCRETILSSNTNSVNVNEITASLLKECGKENVIYKMEAIKCTAEVLNSLKQDAFKEMLPLIRGITEKGRRNGNDDDDDSNEKNSKSASTSNFLEVAFEALGKSWPEVEETQDLYYMEFCDFLCSSLESQTIKVKISIIKSIDHFVDRLYLFTCGNSESVDDKIKTIAMKILTPLCSCIGNIKSSALRLGVMTVFAKVLNKLKEQNRLRLIPVDQLEKLRVLVNVVIQDSQTELHEKGNQVLQLLAN